MRAGLLKEVVEIKRAELVKNELGEETETWNTVYTTRARVENMNSSVENQNDELTYVFTKRFTMRFYVPVQEFDRILWRDKLYRVISIDKDIPLQQLVVTGELIND